MALGLKYYFTIAGSHDPSVTLHRFNLFEEGFVGAAAELEPGLLSGDACWSERYGSDGDEVYTPLQESAHTVAFAPIVDGTPGVVDSDVLDTFKTIATAGPRDYLLVHLHDGVEYYRGWVIPRSSRVRAHEGMQYAVLEAKARLRSLDGQLVASNTGRRAASVLIAEYLAATGHSLSFVEESTAKPNAEAGNPLDTLIPEMAFWRQRPDQEVPVRMTKAQALSQILTAFNLTCRQYNGAWRLSNAGVRSSGTTITQRTYDTAGAFVSSTSGTFFSDLDAAEFILGSSDLAGAEPIRESRVVSDSGPFTIGSIVNPGFELWGSSDTPVGWTDTASAASYMRFDGIGPGNPNDAANRFSRGIIGAVTLLTEEPSQAQKKAAATVWTSQDIGTFTTTSVPMRLAWQHMVKTTYDYTAPIEEQGFVRIKYVVAATTYYWVGSGTDHEGSFSVVTGDDAKHPMTTLSVNYAVRDDWIDIDALPGGGTLTVEFGQVVRGDLDFKSGDNTLYVTYDNAQLDRNDDEDTGEEAREYVVVGDGVTEGLIVEDTLTITDGPFASARGAMLQSDGSTLTGNWQRNTGETQRPHGQMVAAERIVLGRRSRQRLRFTLPGHETTTLSPLQTAGFNSARLWPVQYEYFGPSFNRRLYMIETPEDTASAITATDGARSGVGVFGGGRVSIFDVLSPRVTNTLIKTAATVTTATIDSGAQTTATINPVGTKFLEDNEIFTIVDIATNETYDLTMNGDYTPSGTTLTFDSNVFDHPVKTGSYVFKGVAATLVKLILTEAGLSVVVGARELTTFKIAVTGSKTQLTASDIEPLNYETLDQVPLKAIKADNTVVSFFANGQQAAASATLDIEATAGVGDAVDFGTDGVPALSSIQLADDRDLVPTKLNVFFNGITVQAPVVKTVGWDGVIDANGNVTTPGTQGWALTGVLGQPGDADISGTLHFAGGVAGGGGRAGAGGVQLDAEGGKFSGGSLDWWDGGLAGTRVLSMGAIVDLGAVTGSYIEAQDGYPLVIDGVEGVTVGNGLVNIGIPADGNTVDIGTHFRIDDSLNVIDLLEITTPAGNPSAGRWWLYPEAGGLYLEDDAGARTLLSGGGGSSNADYLALSTGTTDLASVAAGSVDHGTTFQETAIRYYDSAYVGNFIDSIPAADAGVLAFQNSTNALIGTNIASPLVFYTSATECMRFASTGEATFLKDISVTPASADGELAVVVTNSTYEPRVYLEQTGGVAWEAKLDATTGDMVIGIDGGESAFDITRSGTSISSVSITGDVGIGATAPVSPLQVGTGTPPGFMPIGRLVTAWSDHSISGGVTAIFGAQSNDDKSVQAVEGYVYLNASSPTVVGLPLGVNAIIEVDGTLTVTEARSVHAQIAMSANGTVTEGTALHALLTGATGTLTKFNAVKAAALPASGVTITRADGFYMPASSGYDWGVYIEDTLVNNFFGGGLTANGTFTFNSLDLTVAAGDWVFADPVAFNDGIYIEEEASIPAATLAGKVKLSAHTTSSELWGYSDAKGAMLLQWILSGESYAAGTVFTSDAAASGRMIPTGVTIDGSDDITGVNDLTMATAGVLRTGSSLLMASDSVLSMDSRTTTAPSSLGLGLLYWKDNILYARWSTDTPVDLLSSSAGFDLADNEKIRFGTGLDSELYFNATDTLLDMNAGAFTVRDAANNEMFSVTQNTAEIYWNGSVVFEGVSGGVSVTGTLNGVAIGSYWNSGNDGSGSGLDADTVDALQATQFVRSDTADTATGLITFTAGIQLNDSDRIFLGTGDDAELYFDGASFTVLALNNGSLDVRDASSNSLMQISQDTVALYWNNSIRFQGTAAGTLTTGVHEVTDSLVIPFSTNPTTPGASKAALYLHNYASGSDHLAFENSTAAKFSIPHFAQSDDDFHLPILNADLHDDSGQALGTTDTYIHVVTQDGTDYYVRLYD